MSVSVKWVVAAQRCHTIRQQALNGRDIRLDVRSSPKKRVDSVLVQLLGILLDA